MGGAVFDAMDDETIMGIVHAWRKAHPATKSFWYDIEGAARSAVREEGESFAVREDMARFDRAAGVAAVTSFYEDVIAERHARAGGSHKVPRSSS